MTITTPRPSQNGPVQHGESAPIEWTVIQSGLWVGKASGEFAGMIEARWGVGFAATRLGSDLGVYRTVAEAKASFTR